MSNTPSTQCSAKPNVRNILFIKEVTIHRSHISSVTQNLVADKFTKVAYLTKHRFIWQQTQSYRAHLNHRSIKEIFDIHWMTNEKTS